MAQEFLREKEEEEGGREGGEEIITVLGRESGDPERAVIILPGIWQFNTSEK